MTNLHPAPAQTTGDVLPSGLRRSGTLEFFTELVSGTSGELSFLTLTPVPPVSAEWRFLTDVVVAAVQPSSPPRLVLVVDPHELAVPLYARVEVSSAGPTLVDPETGIWGVGTDAASALVDFLAALRQHRDVLNDMGDLSSAPDLEAQLRYLDVHLVPASGGGPPR